MAPISRTARAGALLALALGLQALEGSLPPVGPLPGGRLGLANAVTLLALLTDGVTTAGLLAALRPLLGSLLLGTFLTPAYWFSQSGALLAWAVEVGACFFYPRWLSVVGLGLLGAAAHNLGQYLLAGILLGPLGSSVRSWLLLLALPTGLFTGLLAGQLERITGTGLPLRRKEGGSPAIGGL